MEGLGKYGSSGEEYEDSEEEEGVEAKSPPPFETLTAFVPVSPAFPTTNSYPTSFDTYKAVAVNSVGNSNSEQQQEVNKNEKEQIKNKREKKKSKKDKKKKDKTSLDSVDEFVAKKKIPIANQVRLHYFH